MYFRQFLDQYIILPTSRYRQTKTFSGIKGPVNAIAFIDHRFLVSGGDDHSVSVWDIQTHRLLQRLHDRGTDLWGQITCLVCTSTPEGGQGFIAGTGRGVIIAFKLIKTKKAEFQELDCVRAFFEDNFVEAMAFDPTHKRLVVSSHKGGLKLYQMESNGTLIEKWEIPSQSARLVRGIHFVEQGQKFLTFTMESGAVHEHDTITGKENLDNKRSLQSFVGNVDYFPDTQAILVDNLMTGFDIYTPPRTSPNQRFEVKRHGNQVYAVEVKFGEGGALVVGGSDHGVVYIFQSDTGDCIQTLLHGNKSTLVQAIATFTSPDGEHIIASGSSRLPTSSICIWRRPVSPTPRRRSLICV
ncbi:hypothetical protein CVT24_002417 [Panaeolus cyanescens]|uniref:Uncharacterized protein n=1 Tax=Panaeolus cyanescens TaxID=181874 RepID=A0A409WZW7_9AGAR|nr:hypothetical protein CVT24_002417 [Panaeolus cyanescens]